MLERLDHLDQRDDAGGGFGVADVGLRRPQQQRRASVASAAEDFAECGGLDRVAEDGAGAVGFDHVDLQRVHAGVVVGAAQHVYLGVWVGGGQAVGVAVGVGGRALDHGDDVVAVGDGVVDTLEHDEACGVGSDDAVGVVGKRVDAPGRRDHAQLRKRKRGERVGQDVHAAG